MQFAGSISILACSALPKQFLDTMLELEIFSQELALQVAEAICRVLWR